MKITKSELRSLIREEIIKEIQLQIEPDFHDAFNKLLDYVGGMEQAFEKTARSTNDGVKRAILQGMYTDFMELKSNNWRKFINILNKKNHT
jgi:translation initiation factor 2 beta subunit (eIF-2beta)/eIF-5